MKQGLVIGGGPAGLMAAEAMAAAGLAVTLCEAMPTMGRKFLMAGKSGLNLTKAEDLDQMMPAFAQAAGGLRPMVAAFDSHAVAAWAEGLGQPVFQGSTGRVFPAAMKASPLLRAWLRRLEGAGVRLNTRWRWTGFDGAAALFDTPEGPQSLAADVTVLALGGASWKRLGADGAWAGVLGDLGVKLADFAPANAAVAVPWSAHMQGHFGAPLKAAAWRAGPYVSRGEAVLSARGLEGGGIYSVSRGLREGHELRVDLRPDLALEALAAKLSKPRGKASQSNFLRKAAGLDPVKLGLMNEMLRPLPQAPEELARRIKDLPIHGAALRPLDEAISTAGGVKAQAVDAQLMLRARPGTFVAGEMLDWEAPTGGYLINACLATGRWAGQAAADYARARTALNAGRSRI
ncbi:MAG: TIGR03862 family flavoprotein [Sulfitobacter sp.]